MAHAHEMNHNPAGAAGADRRASERLSCVDRRFVIDVDHEIGCLIIDVSRAGFSVIARESHVPGAIAELTVHLGGGEVLVGRGAVTSSARVLDGQTRYGIHVLNMPGSTLAAAMPRIVGLVSSNAESAMSAH